MGEPLIKPQVNLKISGIGQRFDGTYRVTKADHTYGASGYTTSFEVERMADGGTPS
jgi:phage protein D